MRPHRRQPTRLPRPWDSPGKNTGVGCHFLLQSMKVKSESEAAQSCPTLHDPMDCSLPGSSVHGICLYRWHYLKSPSHLYIKVNCKKDVTSSLKQDSFVQVVSSKIVLENRTGVFLESTSRKRSPYKFPFYFLKKPTQNKRANSQL